VTAAAATVRAEPARLSRLAPDYDVILCDVWGVIRDGERVIPEALDALVRFRRGGGRVLLLSNSPRRNDTLRALLTDMGAPDGAWDGAVTSGDATRALLESFAPGSLYRLGADFDAGLYEGLDVAFGPLDEAVAISCTGLEDYFNETPEDYRDLLTEAKLRRLPLVCANPDIVVQGPDGKLLWCAGALAKLYEELGGEALYAGKPHPPVYDLAFSRLEALSGAPVDRSRVLAIGDGPATDLLGAQQEGLDALFITGGIHGDDIADPSDRSRVDAFLAGEGTAARHAAPALVW
jgi:HAD superfamily hydrolase (TIGR01459 family)